MIRDTTQVDRQQSSTVCPCFERATALVLRVIECCRSCFDSFCEWSIQTKKLIIYKISLIPTILYNQLWPNKYPWFQSVIEDRLTLGAIPLKNRGHLDSIPQHGVTTVLTALEPFETNTKTFYSQPVSRTDWKAKGVTQYVIDTPDFQAVPLEKIKEGVEVLHQEIERKRHVYVHCKAGRGRSATIVVAYLLKYGHLHGLTFNSVNEAIAYVKTKRPVINMNPHQTKALHDYKTTYLSSR